MDETERKIYQSKIESLLFAYGSALSSARIANALNMTEDSAREILDAMVHEYQLAPERGVCVIRQDGKYLLGTKPENLESIEQIVKQDFEQDLSNASMETLSIILYRAPVARADIDAIRGVNSSFIIRNLSVRGLVEREQDAKGHHGYLYKPSFALLQLLGIHAREELPDFETLSKKFEALVQESEKQLERTADATIAPRVSE